MDADGVRPEDGAAVECGPAGVGWFVGARGRPAPARGTWIAVMAVVLGTSPARPAVTTNADGDPDVTGQVDLGNRIAV